MNITSIYCNASKEKYSVYIMKILVFVLLASFFNIIIILCWFWCAWCLQSFIMCLNLRFCIPNEHKVTFFSSSTAIFFLLCVCVNSKWCGKVYQQINEDIKNINEKNPLHSGFAKWMQMKEIERATSEIPINYKIFLPWN